MFSAAIILFYFMVGVPCWMWLWVPIAIREVDNPTPQPSMKELCYGFLPVTMILWPVMIPIVLYFDREFRTWYKVFNRFYDKFIKKQRETDES